MHMYWYVTYRIIKEQRMPRSHVLVAHESVPTDRVSLHQASAAAAAAAINQSIVLPQSQACHAEKKMKRGRRAKSQNPPQESQLIAQSHPFDLNQPYDIGTKAAAVYTQSLVVSPLGHVRDFALSHFRVRLQCCVISSCHEREQQR